MTVALLATACSGEQVPAGHASSAASPHTKAANHEVAQSLPLSDAQDFNDARRGLVATESSLVISGPDGTRYWDLASYDFVQGDAPATVNPSLWRQAQLNNIHGLFEVVPGIYQVRGYDLSNMTLIQGRTGWILVDPLTTAETASAALALARKHLGDRPITAVIFTHSHRRHTRRTAEEPRHTGSADLRARGLQRRGNQREHACRPGNGAADLLLPRRAAAAQRERARR
jgi:alkyl sulfatase BDS1-like metallo-beta-lactamase superfamily hydrolase